MSGRLEQVQKAAAYDNMQAEGLASRAYYNGLKNGQAIYADFMRRDMATNPDAYLNGIMQQKAAAELLAKQTGAYNPIRVGADADVREAMVEADAAGDEVMRLANLERKLRKGEVTGPVYKPEGLAAVATPTNASMMTMDDLKYYQALNAAANNTQYP